MPMEDMKMDDTNLERLKLWEMKSKTETRVPDEFQTPPNMLELWRRDDGAFMFLATDFGSETAIPFYIEHPEQAHELIKACVRVINELAHVPARIPEGIEPTQELVLTYFNGHQVQANAAYVTDWSVIEQAHDLLTGEMIYHASDRDS